MISSGHINKVHLGRCEVQRLQKGPPNGNGRVWWLTNKLAQGHDIIDLLMFPHILAFMVPTIKCSKYEVNLTIRHPWFSSFLVRNNHISRKSWWQRQALEYRLNWEIYTLYTGAAGSESYSYHGRKSCFLYSSISAYDIRSRGLQKLSVMVSAMTSV